MHASTKSAGAKGQVWGKKEGAGESAIAHCPYGMPRGGFDDWKSVLVPVDEIRTHSPRSYQGIHKHAI
jgi:hypothetical protein